MLCVHAWERKREKEGVGGWCLITCLSLCMGELLVWSLRVLVMVWAVRAEEYLVSLGSID